jgi:hypothetical protein
VETFATGTIRLDFVGDGGALQAWAVVKSGIQSFEVPFVPSDKVAEDELISYWDVTLAGPQPKTRVEYRITNTTPAAVPFNLVLSRGADVTRVETGNLGSFQTRLFEVSNDQTARSGWVRLTHSGPSRALIGAGVVMGMHRLAYLPLVAPEATQRGPGFETLSIPHVSGNPSRTRLTLFNSSDVPNRVTLEAVAEASGALVAVDQIVLAGWEVKAVDLDRVFPPRLPAGTRVRLRASTSSLMVDGAVVAPSGEVLDVSVHATSSAHKSGTYPIPDLDRYAVSTRIVNIGAEPSEIIAQYFWDGGSYTVPSFSGAGWRLGGH